MVALIPMDTEHEAYLRDESRSTGSADSISFPRDEAEIVAVLQRIREAAGDGAPAPVTVQGARTGLAAGAVPGGGHVMNLSRANRYLGLRVDEDGVYCLRVQPGVVLAELRRHLADKSLPVHGWSSDDLRALERMYAGPEQFFPTDPTETSACLGGMAACNASGARSFRYGPMRPHIRGMRVVLADGDVIALRRGEVRACGRRLRLQTESGRKLDLSLPTYDMPQAKNASGYYIADDMDAIDLFIGSDGTLGIISELELALSPVPAFTWGVSCFLADERAACEVTEAVRASISDTTAIEYFDADALDILRRQRALGAAFSALPPLADAWSCCVYVELSCAERERALSDLALLGKILVAHGGSVADTWVARTDTDRETLRFFRHAVPESVNMLIDERRRTDPAITKLGSDMSVPDGRLHDVMALYRSTLADAGLESAAWGHIGDNHLHVNILPRSMEDYAAGKRLFARWAAEVSRMGGAVSAEHGVGKLKRDFLATMYGEEHVREMAQLKRQLDPWCQLGQGNLFDVELARGGDRA